MRRILFLVVLLGLAGGTDAKAPESQKKDMLETLRVEHPRLMLTDKRLAELKTLARTDTLLARCVEDVLLRADKYLKAPPLQHKKIGKRLLAVSRDCLDRALTLGLAYRWTGQAQYAQRLRSDLLTVCAFGDWNPTHFLDTAEMCNAVGIGYDWIYGVLSEQDRQAIRAGLIRNGLDEGLAAYRENRNGWWVQSNHNWNQVCNFGLMVGALAIAETDPPYAREILPAAAKSLPKALASYNPDGAWAEGPMYWDYATRYTAFGLSALDTAMGSDLGLSEQPGLKRAGYSLLHLAGPTGLLFNFADARLDSRLRPTFCLAFLAGKFDDPVYAWFHAKLLQGVAATAGNVVWYVPAEAHKPQLPLDCYFRSEVEVACLRSAWDDPSALYLAVKAGWPGVNHGQMDVGSFVLDALGQRWVCDLGADDYDLPGYFSGGPGGKRWTYYRLNAMSHNVPTLNGCPQAVEGRGSFVAFESAPDAASAVLNLGKVYAQEARGVYRGVALLDGRRSALVQDEFEFAERTDLAWGLTTQARIELDGASARLDRNGKQMLVRILEPAGATFAVESARQQPPQNPNEGISRLVIHLKGQTGRVRVAVQFVPGVGRDEPLPALRPLSQWPGALK